MKRVFVSGSTRGLGKAIAVRLLEEGYSVTIHGRSESDYARDTYDSLQTLFGESVQSLYFDVGNQEAAASVLTADVERYGAYFGIVCNAGCSADVPLAGMSYDQWRHVLRVNLDSFYHIVQPLLLPLIRCRSGGRIVVMSSLSGVAGNRGQVNYSASKAGLIGAAKALSRELASRKITVNCVAPGAIETDMLTDEIREQLVSSIPMKRCGRVEEVAHAVQFFFDPLAEFVTGQVLSVNGGVV